MFHFIGGATTLSRASIKGVIPSQKIVLFLGSPFIQVPIKKIVCLLSFQAKQMKFTILQKVIEIVYLFNFSIILIQ